MEIVRYATGEERFVVEVATKDIGRCVRARPSARIQRLDLVRAVGAREGKTGQEGEQGDRVIRCHREHVYGTV